jgi:hypothetical protein
MENIGQKIVGFHTGRGGRFYNAGHITFIGECKIGDFSFFEKLGFKLGEKQYFDCGGKAVGLTEKEVETGVGVIDNDGEYDTTVCLKLEDCSENQLKMIVEWRESNGGYLNEDILNYAKEKLETTYNN